MHKHPFLSAFLFSCVIACVGIPWHAGAQTTGPDQWTWMGGSRTAPPLGSGSHGNVGVYGTLGTPASGNIPGAREFASTWTDSAGRLWLFGGGGTEKAAVTFNDLWEFDPDTNEWTWMSGSSSSGQGPVYGTQGVPAPENVPGAREGASTWIDRSGNLWLFGGSGIASDGVGALNDLWEFNPSTHQWTWVTGSKITLTCANGVCGTAGVYGSLGISAEGNTPGGRNKASSWTDSNGNFWLFGGSGVDSADNQSDLNDLWEFNPSTSLWAWMGGVSTVPLTHITYPIEGAVWGVPGAYGTLGVPAPANGPGSRYAGAAWSDIGGNFWLFGGNGLDANGNTGDLNDLWQFNPSTNEWTWMGGDATLTCTVQIVMNIQRVSCPAPAAIFGTLGSPAVTNVPGGVSGATPWTDANGKFWLFGGGGDWGTNILWEFDPTSKQWTWMGGGSWGGNCGALGVPATGNIPGNRTNASGWTDGSGNLWLFGGTGTDCVGTTAWLNDVWEYQPSLSATFPTVAATSFSPQSGTYSSAQSVVLSDSTPGASIYYTTDGLTTPSAGSTPYTGPITVASTQTIQAIAVEANYLNSKITSASYVITFPVAATPTFSPAAGNYTSVQTVAIVDSTPQVIIYYTTDGTTPTASSSVYSGPLNVSATETIKAIAMASGYTNSAVGTAAYTINIPPPDFSISINPASLSLQAGQSGTTTITTTDINGFENVVTFACSGLPAGISCSFAPQADSAPTGVSYTTLTVTASQSVALLHPIGSPLLPAAALGLMLGCIGWRRPRRIQMIVLLLAGVAALSLLNGCGGGKKKPITATVTVTATATSQSLQHSTTFLLAVN